MVLLAMSAVGAAALPDARVVLDKGRVSIRSQSTPLSDVLSRFAQATGAQVVYEAARPSQPVSVAIEAGSPAEAIAQLLEGQGLNYALRLDPSGRKVEMLVITGNASLATTAVSGGRNPRPQPPEFRPPEERPFEEDEADREEADPPFAPEVPEHPDPAAPPGTSPVDTMNTAPGSPWPGAAPGFSSGPPPSDRVPDSAIPEPDQPQVPGAASYPGALPESPPPPPPPVEPSPASYPRGN